MHVRQQYFQRVLPVVCLIALILTLASGLFAQSGNGSVRGLVRDQTGAVIPGAHLELTNKATNNVVRTEANEAGLYVFPSVIAGEYNLTVVSAGMETLDR